MAKKAKPAKAAHLAHDRVVAFIDILGFQDLVEKKMPKDKVFYQWMQETFKELEDQHVAMAEGLVDRMDLFPSNPALQMAHFSDSIVFTSDMEIPEEAPNGPQKAADRVVVMTIMAVIDLFRRGILVRGGIASGWTFH